MRNASVATLNNTIIINFDDYPLETVKRTKPARLRAWDAAEGAERRCAMFDWLSFYVPSQDGVLLFSDFATAFLLAFEITFQYLREDFNARTSHIHGDWGNWLNNAVDPEDGSSLYTLETRGLRTLRQLVAHHRLRGIVFSDGADRSFFAGADGGLVTARRHFAPLDAPDLAPIISARHKPKIDPTTELKDWNGACARETAPRLMRQALWRLWRLLEAAERDFF